jgi:hypothetical protein
MANRDYRAEYARRQATARASGYRSYWHQRQTQQAAADYTGASRRAFISTAKNPPPVYDDATLLSPPTLMAVITDGSVGSVDRDSWEGQLIGSPGKPMTVSWNASVPTGITMMFRMWGFDL